MKMKLIAMLVTVGLCGSVMADVANVAPSADLWVLDTHVGNTTFGDHIEMRVGYRPSATRHNNSLIKFDLSGIDSGLTITSAKLYMYSESVGANTLDLGIYEVADDSWTEAATHWGNQPASGALVASQTGGFTIAGYNMFDITSSIASAHGGDSIWSGVFKSVSGTTATDNVVSFRSRDAASGLEPYLEITTIPESATMALFGVVGLAAFATRRFRI